MKTRQHTRNRVVGKRECGGAIVARSGWVDVVVMRCNFLWSRCQAFTQGACCWTNYTLYAFKDAFRPECILVAGRLMRVRLCNNVTS
jgi:hypothetical protein